GMMFILMFFSSVGETAIMDDLAHIPAGYSYLAEKDYRLNPEHPPLAKDLAAFPLLFLNLNFPTDVKAWQEDVNGQWDMGRIFLYESGNDAGRILFWSRLPMMLLALFFGWLIFTWSRGLYGDKVGLMTLLLFSFSPTFLAHSRYVTTDLGASLGFFAGIIFFIRFLEFQSSKRLFAAGAVLGGALLLKFSLVLLMPLYLLLAVLWLLLNNFGDFRASENKNQAFKKVLTESLALFSKILAIFAIAAIAITAVYQYHVWNYPESRQLRDSAFLLGSFGLKPAVNAVLWMIERPILRPFAQYLLGLMMVAQRAAGGNTSYFLGEVSAAGWAHYFPLAYLFKETLPFLALMLLALGVAVKSVLKASEKSFAISAEWMRDNFVLTSSMLFVAVYWVYSITSPLNIGVRHVLPTFPFIYFLVSREIVRWMRTFEFPEPQNFGEWIRAAYERYIRALPRYLFTGFMLLWLILAALSSYPGYLSYYNELAGGTKNGYKLITDSNYDWGQDLKNLRDFVEENNIQKIAVDYFGGGSLEYELGEKFVPWQSLKGRPMPESGDPRWLAVSATIRQNAFGRPVKGFIKKPEDSYLWLNGIEPYSRAGQSIFIYRF
ncbi:MAG: glycosyltransferase family 39 protein, partial [Candidatus Niyogibacteria bacterium]|nr:glycosyltransferase family 39 protein [Candidatus Niyogibacteria bacterium]